MTESLKETVARVVPYFENVIKKDMIAGKRVVIAAHGNSLRALVKYFDNMGDDEIVGVNIPTGVPLVYEFDDNFKVLKKYYLGDQAAIEPRWQCGQSGQSQIGTPNLHQIVSGASYRRRFFIPTFTI